MDTQQQFAPFLSPSQAVDRGLIDLIVARCNVLAVNLRDQKAIKQLAFREGKKAAAGRINEKSMRLIIKTYCMFLAASFPDREFSLGKRLGKLEGVLREHWIPELRTAKDQAIDSQLPDEAQRCYHLFTV